MRITADQIVNNLLEYGMEPGYEERPGSPGDPFRAPGSFGPLKHMSYAPRPGVIPDEKMLNPEDLVDEPPAQEIPIQQAKRPQVSRVHPRFKWRPPTPGP